MCHAGLHGVSKEKLFRGWFLAFSAEHANRGGGVWWWCWTSGSVREAGEGETIDWAGLGCGCGHRSSCSFVVAVLLALFFLQDMRTFGPSSGR